MMGLIDWPRLFEPRSAEEWHTAMATAIRHARYLPEEEIELLAQIAERGPPAKRGRKPYDRDTIAIIEILTRQSDTKAEAERVLAGWKKMDEEAAEKAVRKYGDDRLTERRARDDELFRAEMAKSKQVKAAREEERALNVAEFQKLRVKYDVDPK